MTIQLTVDGVTSETGLSAQLTVTEEPKPEHEYVTVLLLVMVEQNVREQLKKRELATLSPALQIGQSPFLSLENNT